MSETNTETLCIIVMVRLVGDLALRRLYFSHQMLIRIPSEFCIYTEKQWMRMTIVVTRLHFNKFFEARPFYDVSPPFAL